jgi:hypothetical protein
MDESLSEECGESELTTEGIIKTPHRALKIGRRRLERAWHAIRWEQ